jgi:alanyl-tRNA synthetase
VLEVFDTQRPAPDVTVHRARVASGEVAVGEQVSLSIDAARRQAIRLNHSATHLLHAALRNHLGSSVGQAGSLVEASRLRFDFSHDGQIADEKLADIESEVNDVIRSNLEVGSEEMPYKQAIERGAIAFFGEKYGEVVRVVTMGDYSVELCGGTHVRRTGDIGVLRLGGQGGVAAGVRRVEAYTGRGALDEVRRREAILRQVSDLLRSGEEETAERVAKLLATLRQLEKKAASAAEARSGDVVDDLAAAAREIEGTRAVVVRVDGVESKAMRSVSDRVRERLGSCVVVLVGESDAGISLTVAVTDDQTARFHAGKIISQLIPFIDGRGGGKADFAQGGGKDPAGIGSLLEKANELLV